jgi:hypothetical protein
MEIVIFLLIGLVMSVIGLGLIVGAIETIKKELGK